VAFNGNNLVLRGDIVRRVLVCRLDARCEEPQLREFDQDLVAEVKAQRGEIVRDLQTILLAYIRSGKRPPGLPLLGSFNRWDQLVRAALIWAGAADPVAVMARSRRDDPVKQALVAVFGAWSTAFGKESVTLSTVIAQAETDAGLRSALELVALSRGKLDAAKLGYWCRKNRDAQSGSLVLRQDVSATRTIRQWFVESLNP
jgi:putative DNA primase/helicase